MEEAIKFVYILQKLSDKGINITEQRIGNCIRAWRNDVLNIDNKRKSCLTEEMEAERFRVYEQGGGDVYMGKQIGISKTAFAEWREKHGLQPNTARASCII